MPTHPFVAELRSLIGNRPLWLSVAIGVVLNDSGNVLLGRRADTGRWALPGGIIDPGEQPADAAVREIFEETGVVAIPEALSSVSVPPPVTYQNGDEVQYLELSFLCRAVAGQARVDDQESLEVGWHALDALPDLDEPNRRRMSCALDGTGRTAFTFSGLREDLGLPA